MAAAVTAAQTGNRAAVAIRGRLGFDIIEVGVAAEALPGRADGPSIRASPGAGPGVRPTAPIDTRCCRSLGRSTCIQPRDTARGALDKTVPAGDPARRAGRRRQEKGSPGAQPLGGWLC
jgi:hypothetical protein